MSRSALHGTAGVQPGGSRPARPRSVRGAAVLMGAVLTVSGCASTRPTPPTTLAGVNARLAGREAALVFTSGRRVGAAREVYVTPVETRWTEPDTPGVQAAPTAGLARITLRRPTLPRTLAFAGLGLAVGGGAGYAFQPPPACRADECYARGGNRWRTAALVGLIGGLVGFQAARATARPVVVFEGPVARYLPE